MYPSEELLEFWDSIISDKLIDGAKIIKAEFKVSNSVRYCDWLPKYDAGDIYIHLEFAFVGQRDTYFYCVIGVAPPASRNAMMDEDVKRDVSNGDHLMLVDIRKLVKLPEWMSPEFRTSFVWLKRFNNGDSPSRDILDFFLIAPVARQGTFRIDGKGRLPVGFVCSNEGELPSEIVQPRTESISKLSNESGKIVGSDALLDESAMRVPFNIVISDDGIGVFPKFLDYSLEFLKVSIPPTNFHLCMGQPYAQRHSDIIATTIYLNSRDDYQYQIPRYQCHQW